MTIQAGNFHCGCDPKEKLNYSGDITKPTVPGGDVIYSGIRRDSKGYEVCPEHGERLYGWRTHMVATPSGRDAMDWSKQAKGKPLGEIKRGEDRRDNRDPATVYAQMKAGSNGYHA